MTHNRHVRVKLVYQSLNSVFSHTMSCSVWAEHSSKDVSANLRETSLYVRRLVVLRDMRFGIESYIQDIEFSPSKDCDYFPASLV